MISLNDLEITDLFEDNNAADDVQPNEGRETEENNENDESAATTVKGAAKRIVRNPQPKLNPQRLCGDRGIVQLPKIFAEVKLKGKGHEKEDLDIVMKTLEHWSHRLFPKFTFDDVLERIEKLGSKKTVQNCVNRIRLDMPVLSEDYDNNKDDAVVDSEDENVPPVIDAQLHASLFGPASTSQENRSADVASSPTVNPPVAKVLTAEQLAKIEKNRLLALERRAARLQDAAQSASTSVEGILKDNNIIIDDELLCAISDSELITNAKETANLQEQIDGKHGETDASTSAQEVMSTFKPMPEKEMRLPTASSNSQKRSSNSDSSDGVRATINASEFDEEKFISQVEMENAEAGEKTSVSDQIETHEPMDIDEMAMPASPNQSNVISNQP